MLTYRSVGSPPSSQCSLPVSSTDTVTNVSANYQFPDAGSTVDELDYGFPSYPISIVEDINLAGVLPLDMNLFGDSMNWMNDRIDSQNQRWPRQISFPNSYGELLSPPLEGLFPYADQALKADPAETGVAHEVRPPAPKACAPRSFTTKKILTFFLKGKGYIC